MILRLADEQQAQTFPFVAGIILLVVAVLFTSLAISSISEERTNQQAIADSAALAGANAITKANQTIKLINFVIWLRNAVLNLLYLAAAIATAASLGTLASLFDIPIQFDRATKPAMEALEKAKRVIAEVAPVYAIGNSVAYIQVNNSNSYLGVALPFPMKFARHAPSARELELKKKIEDENKKIVQARGPLEAARGAYYRRKEELLKQGMNEKDLSKDRGLQDLLRRVRETSGRVGGFTGWRNTWVNELAQLESKRGYFFDAGQDGVVAIVTHKSTAVPFSSFFSGKRTGPNLAVAAAKSVEGRNDAVVGEEAIKQLFSKIPGLSILGGALTWLLDALNIFGRKIDSIGAKYGKIGKFIGQALNGLRLIPPNITEERPALINIADATKQTLDVGGVLGKVRGLIGNIRGIEDRLGRKVLPDGFEI